MLRLVSVSALFIMLVSCSDDVEPPDGGSFDGGGDAAADVGQDVIGVKEGGADLAADTSPDTTPDMMKPDMPASDCNLSLDLKPLVLDSGYCVVHRPALTGAPAAFNFSGDTLYTFTMGSAAPFAGKILQWPIDPKTGKLGASTSLLTFTPTTSAATVYPSAFLALSSGGFAAVGYTEKGTFAGQIFWGDKGIKTPKKVDKATGNYDAVMLNDKTLLINGTGAGAAQSGQGVYVAEEGKAPRLLIKDMGTYSGFMAMGKSVIFAGGYFTAGNKIFGFSLAEINDAVKTNKTLTSAADGDVVHSGGAADAAALGDDLVVSVSDSSYKFKAVQLLAVTVAGNTVSAAAAKDLVTAAGGASVTALATSDKQLGLMVANGTTTELAIVQSK